MRRILSLLFYLMRQNFKTLRFNYTYFPFKTAVRCPIIISKHVDLKQLQGSIEIVGKIKRGMIKIGFGSVGIFDKTNSRTIWQVSGRVVFKGRANIGHGSKISVGRKGSLILGNRFKISAETSIVAQHHIEIGEDCLLSWGIMVMDTDFHPISDKKGNRINPDSPIYIADHVWIGCRSTILKGTLIPEGSVVAADSCIAGRLTEANAIYTGLPVHILKKEISWSHK